MQPGSVLKIMALDRVAILDEVRAKPLRSEECSLFVCYTKQPVTSQEVKDDLHWPK